MHGFAAKLLRSLQTSLLMEQLNYNLRVGGSNPSERAKNTYVHDDDFGIQTPNSRNRAPL